MTWRVPSLYLICSFLILMPGLGGPGGAARAERIVVHGITPPEMKHEVQKMFHEQWDSQLPRWDAQLCPVVVGLNEPFRRVVLDRLYAASDPRVGKINPQCARHNVFIVFSENGTATFNLILSRVPTLGDGYDSAGVSPADFDLPAPGLLAALKQDRPVRWYRSTSTDPASGSMAMRGLVPAGGLNGIGGAQGAVFRFGASSLGKGTQSRTTATFVVVDTNLAAGATWRQLADYIAFVVLADPEMGVAFNTGSILSLFNDGRFQSAAPASMTALDSTLLDGLYRADPAQDAHSEQVEIARSTLAASGSAGSSVQVVSATTR